MKFDLKCGCGSVYTAEDEHDRTEQYGNKPIIADFAREWIKQHANCILFPYPLNQQQVDTIKAAVKIVDSANAQPKAEEKTK